MSRGRYALVPFFILVLCRLLPGACSFLKSARSPIRCPVVRASLPTSTLVAVGLVALFFGGVSEARAYTNEVYLSGGTYRWKINNVEQGVTADLSTAITNCVWNSTGAGREIHILVGGSLSSTLGMPPDVKIFGHGNTFAVAHGGYAVHARKVSNIQLQDMTVTSATTYVFRISGCNNVVLSGINIDGGFIGMRVESSDSSQPWNFTSYNLTVTNCRFENMNSHGLETYGIDGAYVDGIVARNNGECGVLFNNTRNVVVGTVDAYRCSYGGGYAGLRFANDCSDATVKYLKAVECGRGFFTVTGAKNIVVEELYVRDCTSHAILIQNSDGVGINSGTYNGVALYHYTSINSWILATDATGVTTLPPSAPLSLSGTVGTGGISMSWPAVTGATTYLLQRATTGGGPYRTVARQDTTSFMDRNVVGGTTYYYVVRAINAGGPGNMSPTFQATATTPAVNLNSGLRLHYPFDGSGAERGGGAAAAITGTPTYFTGLVNQSLGFDGASNLATLQTLASSEYGEFSSAAWIWQGSSADWQRFFDFGSSTTNYMILTRLGTMLRFDICRNGAVQTVQIPAPPLNRWVHVAVTFSGNWATLYLNGATQKAVLFGFNPSQINLTQNYLGKSRFSDPLFTGRLDEVRIYNRGLSGAEVAALVTNSPPLPPYDLIAGGFGTKVNLQWTGVVNAITYDVKRSTIGGGPYVTIASGLTGTSYWDNSVSTGMTYYYVVTSRNPQGESVASNQAAAVVSDLVAHLKFNETSGTTAADSSGNSWSAALVNGAAFGPGFLKNALNLPNTSAQHATFPAGVVSGLNDFTISTWVKVDAFSTFARIFDFGSGTGGYMMLTPQYTTGTDAAKMRFAITNTGSGGEQPIISSTAIPLNTWTHVAVTLSGNTGRLYLNGVQVGSSTAITLRPSSLGNTTQNYLGRSQWADPYFTGAIDDFRIYARALSAAELTTLARPAAEPPDNVTVIPDDGKATISWTVANAATTYTVKRSLTSGGPYTTVSGGSGLTSMTFIDSGLTNGVTYYYVVTSSNSLGESVNSAEVAATPSYLRLQLKFDETSDTVALDSSGRGSNATTVNNPAWITGKLNNALSFSQASSQYATLPSGIVNDLTTATLMTWVYVNTQSTWQRIFDFGTGTANNMCLTTQYDGTGRLRFGIRTPSVSEEQINSSVALPAGTWAHVAVVLNGGTGTLYINGTQVGQNTAMTLKPSSLGNTTLNYLGKSQWNDPYLNGALDDFRIYSRAMTASEIGLFAVPLASPQNVTSTSGAQEVSLAWSAVANATGYTVKVSSLSGGPYTTVASGLTSLVYTHTGFLPGETRYYVVNAVNVTGDGPDSSEISATTLAQPPVPLNLVAAADSTSVSLTWSASVSATGYTVRRSTVSSGPYDLVATGITATGYTDTGLNNGQTYYYIVSAYSTQGESDDSAPASATPAELNGRWRFDDAAGLVASDSSGNGWNGTLVNGPVWTSGANARINGALGLDGVNDHVTLPAGIVSKFNNFTISTWVYVNAFSTWARVFDFGTGTNNYMFLAPQYTATAPNAAKFRFAIRTASVTEQQINSSTANTAGTWNHVAVTLSGNTGTLYLNGVVVGTNASMTLKPSVLGNTTLNYLGRSMFGADPYLNGRLDEFQIYNRALSASEIAALASPPAAPALAATPGDSQATLSWTGISGATGYNLKRATVSGGPYTPVASNVTATGYTDTGLAYGTTYYYVGTTMKDVAESAQSSEISVAPITGGQAWRLARFGTIANIGIAADLADPDGDGVPNLVEYALGTNPASAQSVSLPSVSLLTDPSPALQITFSRIADPALTYTVQGSGDLVTWSNIWNSTGVAGPVTVTDTLPATPHRFLRLRVNTTSP
jgi:fibronectin type 3 domain-containing protein